MGDTKNRYCSKKNGRWAPTCGTQRKMNSENIGAFTDYMMRQKNKKAPEKGPKGIFLEEYKRIKSEYSSNSESELEGNTAFESAMKLIRRAFNPTAFTPIMCLGWIGINAKEEILEAYLKKLSMEDALERAREINDSINFEAISEDEVTSIIETEKGKLKETEGTKREDDDGR